MNPAYVSGFSGYDNNTLLFSIIMAFKTKIPGIPGGLVSDQKSV